MTDNLGCKNSSFVITGNGNGLTGFALSKAKTSLKTAKNRAGQRLMYIPRYKEHTGKKIIMNTIKLNNYE